jgi:Zn-dependent M28 family amino/carboxypeptidase
MHKHPARFLAIALTLGLVGCLWEDSEAPVPSCEARVNDTPQKLLECVTPQGVRAHLLELARIAAANGGSRVTGTPGFNAALDYARTVFAEAGYAVSVQPFDVPTFVLLSPPVLEQRAPGSEVISSVVLTYSGSGDVTAAVGMPTVPTGCLASEFAGFLPGRIALVRRGDCTFSNKAQNAQLAGASGVVLYNNVDEPWGGGIVDPAANLALPVVGIDRATGLRWVGLAAQGLLLHLKVEAQRGIATTYNVLAESTTGRDDAVIVIGAHLDAVNGTVGLDDNGSGVAGVLETARQMGQVRPLNKLRFALWSAEETGLVGSTYYVEHLAPAEKARIALYLNFDMIAAPNYGFFVLDSNGSESGDGGVRAPGSATVENAFAEYYSYRGIPTEKMAIEASSDHWPFFAAGFPVGGIETGAGDRKTTEQAAKWGGTVGQAFDACYHQPCDDISNTNEYALGVNAGAIAWSAVSLAMKPWTFQRSGSESDLQARRLPATRFRGSY